MDSTKFSVCEGCSTEELLIFHHDEDPNRKAYRRKHITGGYGPMIEGEPPAVVRGTPRVNTSGLLALLLAGIASAASARAAADKGDLPESSELRSLEDALAKMDRELLARLKVPPEEAAGIADLPKDLRERGFVISRNQADVANPPGELAYLIFDTSGRGRDARVFVLPASEKQPEPAPEKVPEIDQGGIVNPPPIKSLGIHLCPDGGVVVTEWPKDAPWPPAMFASRSAGHAVGYALQSLQAGRKQMRGEARAEGTEAPPVQPVVMGVDLAGGPDRIGFAFSPDEGLTVPGLRIKR